MKIYKHIVRIHPVENGEPNLHKVRAEHEFWFEASAKKWAEGMNKVESMDDDPENMAVYCGRVNDETGV